MKQHITIEQHNELTEEAQGKYNDWFYHSNDYPWGKSEHPFRYEDEQGTYFHEYTNDGYMGTIPLMNIGQMIEFLDEQVNKHNTKIDINDDGDYAEYRIERLLDGCWRLDEYFKTTEQDNLCDALWEVVKEILNNEK